MTKRWTALTVSEVTQLSDKNKGAWSLKTTSAATNKLPDSVPKEKPQKPAKTRQNPPTEHAEQVKVVQWWNMFARSYRLDPRLLVAIPNGSMLAGDSRMRSIQARRLKNEGVRTGYPDLLLDVCRKLTSGYYGLRIEMKRSDWKEPKSGKALKHWENQCELHRAIQQQGYKVLVCKGHNEAINAIKDYLG